MKKLCLAAAAAVLVAMGGAARAEVITFDDVGNFDFLAGDYHGFTWTNWATISGPDYQASGYKNGVISPNNVACGCASDRGQTIDTISAATPFSLQSGYFTSAWNDGATLTINGFLGANLVQTASAVLNTAGPTFLNLGWTGTDRVEFSIAGGERAAGLGGMGNYFAVDNLSINPAGVPEPATWAMMLVGFGGLGAMLRRRRQQPALATA